MELSEARLAVVITEVREMLDKSELSDYTTTPEFITKMRDTKFTAREWGAITDRLLSADAIVECMCDMLLYPEAPEVIPEYPAGYAEEVYEALWHIVSNMSCKQAEIDWTDAVQLWALADSMEGCVVFASLKWALDEGHITQGKYNAEMRLINAVYKKTGHWLD